MKRIKWILLGFIFLLAFGLALSTGCANKEGAEPVEKLEVEEPHVLCPP